MQSLYSTTPAGKDTGVVVPVRVPSIGQIELFNRLLYLKQFNCVQTNDFY